MRRKPISDERPRFSWWLPALMFALFMGVVVVRYRWIVPALRPAETRSFYSAMDNRETIVELTPDRKRLKVTFYNFDSKPLSFAITEATFNDAPTLEPLPKATVAPYASRVFYLTPIDPRVLDYGDAFSVSYSSPGSTGSQHYSSTRPPYSQVRPSGKIVTVSLVAHADAKPIEIRNPQLMVGKKVIAIVRGQHRLEPGKELTIYSGKPPPKGYKVVFAFRATPWSAWKHAAY